MMSQEHYYYDCSLLIHDQGEIMADSPGTEPVESAMHKVQHCASAILSTFTMRPMHFLFLNGRMHISLRTCTSWLLVKAYCYY
ncbi:hypothetical protein I7I48_10306 [Histoplasma ohiense]|nr:hypothetical protein I7I48_10306 [Histoplasma ohiense (nom. inval.)]